MKTVLVVVQEDVAGLGRVTAQHSVDAELLEAVQTPGVLLEEAWEVASERLETEVAKRYKQAGPSGRMP